MCGRYTLANDPADLSLNSISPEDTEFSPRYDIVPTQDVPVTVQLGRGIKFSMIANSLAYLLA